jgi:hypothetical protein
MHMSQPIQPNPSPDDRLADFTDRVLEGEIAIPASHTDAELRGLEETILRLRRTLPHEALDEQTLKRMQADFKRRTRQASVSAPSVWQLLQPRQRFTLALAGLMLAIILIAVPLLPVTNEPIQGTAGLQPRDMLLLIGIVCVTILLIWVKHRR